MARNKERNMEWQREWRKKHPERVKELSRKSYYNNIDKHRERDVERYWNCISWFSFEKPEDEEFKECWSIKNLQPLEVKKNNAKRNKYAEPVLNKWLEVET